MNRLASGASACARAHIAQRAFWLLAGPMAHAGAARGRNIAYSRDTVRKKLGQLLVESGAVTPEQVATALEHQKSWASGMRLGEILISTRVATPGAVARALAAQFGLPFVELPEPSPDARRLLPSSFLSQHRLVPFQLERHGHEERLYVAVSDPSKLEVVEELRSLLGRPVVVHVAASDAIERTIASLREDASVEPPRMPRPIEVIRFAKKPPRPPEFREEDLKVLDELGQGVDEAAPTDAGRVMPAQMLANLVLLLIRKGVLTERELLDALSDS